MTVACGRLAGGGVSAPRPPWRVFRVRGFTVVELVVTLVVAGILAALAAPAMVNFVKNSRRTTVVNQLVTAINFARSEAVKRVLTVTVCPSTNQTGCSNGNSLASGWIVMIDASLNTGVTPTVTTQVLRVFAPDLDSGTTFLGTSNSGAVKSLNYAANGFPQPALSPNTLFKYCDSRGASEARAVVLSPTGQPRVMAPGDAGAPSALGKCP